MFRIMLFETIFAFKPFPAQVTRKCYAFVFCHVPLMSGLNGEPFSIYVAPILEYPYMGLIMLGKSTFSTACFLVSGPLVSPRYGVKHVVSEKVQHIE